ncbi:MAG: hypothetical protein KDD47_23610 [Acidobacteria bacterium]|nr:hypothetical protein [Acidobacteriota bacterium]
MRSRSRRLGFFFLMAVSILYGFPSAPAEGPARERLLPDLGWTVIGTTADSAVLEIPGRGPTPLFREEAAMMESAASFAPAYSLHLEGVAYSVVAGRQSEELTFIVTTDTAFLTPEGAAIGQEFQTLLADHGGELRQETGWACYLCLPSGWAAGLPVLSDDTKWIPCEDHKLDDAEISWFFKRAGTCKE